MGREEVLVISQTQQIHEEIAALLAKLHKTKRAGARGNRSTGGSRGKVRRSAGGGGGMFWYEPVDAPPPSV